MDVKRHDQDANTFGKIVIGIHSYDAGLMCPRCFSLGSSRTRSSRPSNHSASSCLQPCVCRLLPTVVKGRIPMTAKKVSSSSSRKKSAARKTSSKKKSSTRKYGPKAGKSVEREMKAFKQGKLKSGSGRKVTSRKQAIAIGLSEARKSGAKVPKKKLSS